VTAPVAYPGPFVVHPPPGPLQPPQLPPARVRASSVEGWSVVVTIVGFLLLLYGLVVLAAVCFSPLNYTYMWQRILSATQAIACVVSGIFGVNAGWKKTEIAARRYLISLLITAVVFLFIAGVDRVIALVSLDCREVNDELASEFNCAGQRSTIFFVGFVSLIILTVCCATGVFCAKSLHRAVTADLSENMYDQGTQLQTFDEHPNNGYGHVSSEVPVPPPSLPAQVPAAAAPFGLPPGTVVYLQPGQPMPVGVMPLHSGQLHLASQAPPVAIPQSPPPQQQQQQQL